MYTYINREVTGIYASFPFQLDENYDQGTSWDDYLSNRWVRLSVEQLAFKSTHPSASVEEVFNMRHHVPVVPDTTPEELLERARREKIRTIEEYDRSGAVNGFIVNGVSTWLTPDVRANYRNSIEAADLLGEATITFIIAGIAATATLRDARLMLAQIQRYADRCTIVTEGHKANVRAMCSVGEIEAYDITSGYPEILEFNLSNETI